jgi:hypothetical protein
VAGLDVRAKARTYLKGKAKGSRSGQFTFPPMTMKRVMDGAPDRLGCGKPGVKAKATARAKTEADPCGMTTKKTKARAKANAKACGLAVYIPTHDDEACHGWGTRSVVLRQAEGKGKATTQQILPLRGRKTTKCEHALENRNATAITENRAEEL